MSDSDSDDKKTQLGVAVVSEDSSAMAGEPVESPAPQVVAPAESAPQVVAPAEPAPPGSAVQLPPAAVYPPGPSVSTMPDGDLETLSGRFIRISLWRAFRLQIHTREVLASERRTLEQDARHIVDPEQQAFLAWRRSVLLLVAICFVPLTILRLVEAFDGPPMPTFARIFVLLPAVAEGIFCAVAFDQLKNWTRWKKQRRILFIAWSLYMLAPFIVYLYPFRSAFEESFRVARQAAEIGGMKLRVRKQDLELMVGLAFGVQAQMVLAPKVISLMPGLIRASIVSKLLFPGMTAPGWLMMLAAPLYALFAYIMVLLPYQITGNWYFVSGNAGLLIAQIFIAYSGRALTVPLEANEARHRIQRSWMAYIGIMLLSGTCILVGLYDFITQLNLGVIRIFSGVVAFIANVLLLTLIGTDLIVGGMAHLRRRVLPDKERENLLRYSEAKLDRFSS